MHHWLVTIAVYIARRSMGPWRARGVVEVGGCASIRTSDQLATLYLHAQLETLLRGPRQEVVGHDEADLPEHFRSFV